MTDERSYWFGRKRFGWGISPASWQGWVSIAAYCALMISTTKVGFFVMHPAWKAASTVALTVAFLVVMIVKFDRSERK